MPLNDEPAGCGLLVFRFCVGFGWFAWTTDYFVPYLHKTPADWVNYSVFTFVCVCILLPSFMRDMWLLMWRLPILVSIYRWSSGELLYDPVRDKKKKWLPHELAQVTENILTYNDDLSGTSIKEVKEKYKKLKEENLNEHRSILQAAESTDPPSQDNIGSDETLLAKTEGGRAFVLDTDTRNRHVYAIGKTRMGKTTMLLTAFLEDAKAGRGCTYIDPHGDACEELLGSISRDDLIYFDPSSEHVPAFNPLTLPYEQSKLVEDILQSFQTLYAGGWGDRMANILRQTLQTLVRDTEPHILADIRSILVNEDSPCVRVVGAWMG